MFDRIAPTYDRLNRVLSARSDLRWRRHALAQIPADAVDVLDLCAGTLDFTATLARRDGIRVVACDFSPGMLAAGRPKAPGARLLAADAHSLPLASNSFDAVTCGFGVRNLEDLDAGLLEILRVLRPGGVLVVLDLFRPVGLASRIFHRIYARVVLPLVGGWLSGDRKAYRYLAESMTRFEPRRDFERRLASLGFRVVRGRDLSLGIASWVCAVRG